jgi:hypothetical protein
MPSPTPERPSRPAARGTGARLAHRPSRHTVWASLLLVGVLAVALLAGSEGDRVPGRAPAPASGALVRPPATVPAPVPVPSTASETSGVPGIATRGFRVGPPLNGAAAGQACFGALARDALRPCRNPRLTMAVVPTPDLARREPNAVCRPEGQTAVLLPCAFGVDAGVATGHFALIGDSHAAQWRGGLAYVAQARGWHGTSIASSGCPYSATISSLRGPRSLACVRWKAAVRRWLEGHPEVTTIFVSGHSGGAVLSAPRRTPTQTQIAGYVQAWRALPATVTQVFVIRDTPRNRSTTERCLRRAMAQGRQPGPACAVLRRVALRRDPAVLAARRMATPAVQVIDMTRHMCSPRMCLPVIGGALVHKDIDHLTQTFATSAGPLLLRQVDAALAARR